MTPTSNGASRISASSPSAPSGAVAARPTPAVVWWSAVRPATLAASVSAVLTGTAVAVHAGPVRWGAGLAALAVGVAIQLGVNFANDYSDHVRGADAKRTGPLRAAASGVVPAGQVRAAALAAFGVAGVAGLVLAVAVDWRLLIAGAACLLAAWLYTGGPRPYGYMGLGEVFVFVFFGLVATMGTQYVESSRVDALGFVMACAMGFFATAILVLNNLRDIDTDAAAGKRTLATRLGRRGTRRLLVAVMVAGFAMPVAAVIAGLASAWSLAALLAAAVGFGAVRTALSSDSPAALVGALKQAAAAQAAFSLLFAAGLLA